MTRVAQIAAVAVLVAGCAAASAGPPTLIVTSPSGAANAEALVGPLRLDVEVVGTTRCYLARTSDNAVHGVVWQYGTKAIDGGLAVPGLADPLLNGDVFWAAGGLGTAPQLGPCDTEPALYLGPVTRTNPVPSG